MGILKKIYSGINVSIDNWLEKSKQSSKAVVPTKAYRPIDHLIVDDGNQFKEKYAYGITFDILRQMAMKDSVVSCIISWYKSQLSNYTQPQPDRYSPGFKFFLREAEAKPSKEQKEQIKVLEDFILNTGSNEGRTHDNQMNFGQFMGLIGRDILVYDQIAVETIKNKGGGLAYFLPTAAGSIRYASSKLEKKDVIENALVFFDNQEKRDSIIEKENQREPEERFKYVQVFQGQLISGFYEDELILQMMNPVTDLEARGYCYVPGANILLSDGGIKTIENIEITDQVFTHTGCTQIINKVNNRDYNGNIYKIFPYGMEPHEITDEHPLLILSEGATPKDYVRFNDIKHPTWIAANKIKKTDYVCIPKIHPCENDFIIDVAGILDINRRCWNKNGYLSSSNISLMKIPDNLVIDTEWAWFLGLYLGDGCIGNNKTVRIDLGKHETWIISRLSSFLEKYNIPFRVGTWTGKNINMQSIWIYSSILTDIVKNICNGNAHTKKIDPRFITAHKDIKLALIEGWIDADGKHNNIDSGYDRSSQVSGCTVSSSLAYGISLLCNTMGFLAKVQKYIIKEKENEYTTHPCVYYTVTFPSIWQQLGFKLLKNKIPHDSNKRMYLEDSNYFYVRISEIEKYQYDGPVFNFEVHNDHSFVVNGIASHNSIGPLELAANTITYHLYTEAHNKMFFVNGIGGKGILHFESNDNIVESPAQQEMFRKILNEQVKGSANAWRIPLVFSEKGEKVEWISLNDISNKDMEWQAWNNYLIKIICSLFAIDPSAINFDISRGESGPTLGDSGQRAKVNFAESKNRGLKPILQFIEHIINECLIKQFDESLYNQFEFRFTGIDAESKDAELQRFEKEVKLFKSINEIRAELDLHPIDGGDIILDSNFMQRYMTFSEEAKEQAKLEQQQAQQQQTNGQPQQESGAEDMQLTDDELDSLLAENADTAEKSLKGIKKRFEHPDLMKIMYYKK